MNAPFPTPQELERHKFTIDEVLGMTAQGLVPKRAVLLDGEIYDMPSEGDRHIEVTMMLARRLIEALDGTAYFVSVQGTLLLSAHNAPSPDLYVLSGGPPRGEVPAERILLVIEVADTSLRDDLTASASRYARHSVRDYCVVDLNARAIHVHRDPADGLYRSVVTHNAGTRVQPLLIPDFALDVDRIAP